MIITIEEIQDKYKEYHQKKNEDVVAKNLKDREEAVPEVEKILAQCLDAAECGNDCVYLKKKSTSDIVPVILREKGFRWEVFFDASVNDFVYRISGWEKIR